ncbi:unnamed protein product [Prorocentrum cordatum]|uniref:Uncharacterized protein n=1 Tax=Prorocentrum cordatum TaxID=2364126 RepID=A0ABN9T0Y7_9DINO|nr:unnamed protein product [Polarella glacialis]
MLNPMMEKEHKRSLEKRKGDARLEHFRVFPSKAARSDTNTAVQLSEASVKPSAHLLKRAAKKEEPDGGEGKRGGAWRRDRGKHPLAAHGHEPPRDRAGERFCKPTLLLEECSARLLRFRTNCERLLTQGTAGVRVSSPPHIRPIAQRRSCARRAGPGSGS